MSLLLTSSIFNVNDSVSMANDVIQDSINGDAYYVVVGRNYTFDGHESGFMVKMSSSGSIIKKYTYEGAFSLWFNAITQINDGSYIAVGSYFYSKNFKNEYIWIVNLNQDGDIIWQQAYGDVGIQSDGYDVKATKDGGFIVIGITVEEYASTWVLKFDAKGQLQWDKKYNIGLGFSITQTMDEGYAIMGANEIFNEEGSLNRSPFILRLDSNGNVLWEKVYDEYKIYVPLNGAIIETSNGHFAIVIKTMSIEVDSIGNIIWAIENYNLRLNTIIQTSDGNYGISGSIIDANNFEHAYVATINRDNIINNPEDKKLIWDNVEINYNSGYNKILVDNNGYLVGCGYMTKEVSELESFLAVFDINQNLF